MRLLLSPEELFSNIEEMSAERRREIVARYHELRNMSAVAREYGLSRARVSAICAREGVEAYPPARKIVEKKRAARPRGRPRSSTLRRTTVTLSAEDISFLRVLGDGSVSAGARALPTPPDDSELTRVMPADGAMRTITLALRKFDFLRFRDLGGQNLTVGIKRTIAYARAITANR